MRFKIAKLSMEKLAIKTVISDKLFQFEDYSMLL